MSLDDEFGVPRLPEKVEKWENRRPDSLTLLSRDVASALMVLRDAALHPLVTHVVRATNYLWAMDVRGDIWLAVEELATRQDEAALVGFPKFRGFIHPADVTKLGHPSLIDGREARVAGELGLDAPNGSLEWVLNGHSGRYCRVQPPTPGQLDNVAARFRSLGMTLEVDYL